jgi:hypothetical protein
MGPTQARVSILMNFLHYELTLGAEDIIEVTLDKQANVRLVDDINFHSYRRGAAHRYFGGLAKQSPVRLKAPHAGKWHLVIDLGGYAGTVRASVRVIKG